MSRTTITNSGSQFFTNVSSEKLIGKLCKLVGAKYSNDYLELKNDHIKRGWDTSKIDALYEADPNWFPDKMAYIMSAEEAYDAAVKLRGLIPKSEELFTTYKSYFSEDTTLEDFKSSIEEISNNFEASKGYHCI